MTYLSNKSESSSRQHENGGPKYKSNTPKYQNLGIKEHIYAVKRDLGIGNEVHKSLVAFY